MKKLVLLLAVVFSASLFSCGNKENAAAEAAEPVEEVAVVEEEVATVDTVAADTVATDTVVAAEVVAQ